MLEYFRELFTDKTAFVRALRAVSGASGVFVATQPDLMASLPHWVAPALVFVGLFLKSGDQNPTQDEIAKAARSVR